MSVFDSALDGKQRCEWAAHIDLFLPYHDTEWGYPVDDDRRLFEKVCLESFQSGLSWRLILERRENFRAAFANFDIHKVANFTAKDVQRLLGDAGIVRHRGKIESVINNAARAIELQKEQGSLARYFWSWEPEQLPEPRSVTTIPEAIALSKDLKKRGWKFVGPTTIYSFMQAMGLVNDHAIGCCCREKATELRAAFQKP